MNRIGTKKGAFGLISAALILAMVLSAPESAEATTCKKACHRYRDCVVGFWRKHGKTVSHAQRRKLYRGCMKTCKSNKAKVLRCNATSKNCRTYWNCIKRHYRKR